MRKIATDKEFEGVKVPDVDGTLVEQREKAYAFLKGDGEPEEETVMCGPLKVGEDDVEILSNNTAEIRGIIVALRWALRDSRAVHGRCTYCEHATRALLSDHRLRARHE